MVLIFNLIYFMPNLFINIFVVCQQKARKYEAVRWIMMFAIGVTVGLVGAFQISCFSLLDSNILLMTRECCLCVSVRWACLWTSSYASSPKSNSPWLVIVSFNTPLRMSENETVTSVFSDPQKLLWSSKYSLWCGVCSGLSSLHVTYRK